jgi:aminoglycoside phosphotransferase family enzyme/predicted kinase
MITEDQTRTIDFLTSPAAHGGAAVERIDTHASIVFLANDRALKLKRAVKYDYLDFSTADRRREMCEAEVRLNRRTAPRLYRAVVPVTREADGSLVLGGSGEPVDWLVDMVRFDQDMLLDRLASGGRLDARLMGPLARRVADLHAVAEHRPDHGGRAGMKWVIDGNADAFGTEGRAVFDRPAADRVIDRLRQELERVGVALERRRDGFVRDCHGDLHLRNIVLVEGTPTLFDGVEFNDEISCIDVMYDLAFLLMDLWRRRLPRHANAVLNAYLAETGDYDAVPLLPLFLACRAAVRAKTSATASTMQADERRAADLRRLAVEYLDMSGELLLAAAPLMVAIGGFSGTGKSTLAAALAPALGAAPGAIVLRSDTIRKRLCGVHELERLGAEGYTPEVSRQVYDTLTERAGATVRAGHAVIADAVFASGSDRAAIERAAADAGVPFTGIWLEAPEPLLRARTSRRVADASDATADVVGLQYAQGGGTIAWHHVDASASPDVVLARVAEHLGLNPAALKCRPPQRD